MRRRSREINIFNMSLLDILCGALGAFCFMMLVLLPYYKPPGNKEEMQKKQEAMDQSLKDIEKIKQQISDPKVAEDLTELVKKLEAQIKELQGQLNQALVKIDELNEELKRLREENERLKAQNQQLTQENSQLKKEKEQLEAEKEKLAMENTELHKKVNELQSEMQKLQQELNNLRQRQPFLVQAISLTPRQEIGMYLLDPATYNQKTQPPFDPSAQIQHPFFPGDLDVSSFLGTVSWMIRDVVPGMHVKTYVHIVSSPGMAHSHDDTTIHMNFKSERQEAEIEEFKLTPQHPWMFVGEFVVDDKRSITFRNATAKEREQEWQQVGSASVGGQAEAQKEHVNSARDGAAIAAILTKIAEIRSHPAADRVGALKQQEEVATLEEKLKFLQGQGTDSGKK